ncbi:hypothetical protein ABZS94_35225 [Streptomyces sp. NPDC005500]|uniref:hypothetical protein n=1 Tax=Streptomyces sp. NPDC005500 TaxID=3155007 RepID=UPI0033B8C871
MRRGAVRGAPLRRLVASLPGGQVSVVYGSQDGYGSGRPTARITHITRGSEGVPDAGHDGLLGGPQAVGDVPGDGCADITVADGASRLLLNGGRSGLTGIGSQAITVQQIGLPSTYDEAPNSFGQPRLLNLNGDNYTDLITEPMHDASDRKVTVTLHGIRDGFDITRVAVPHGVPTDAAHS